MKLIYVFVLLLVSSFGYAQKGIIIGTVLGEKDAALEGASVSLISIKDSTARFSTSTDKDGFFFFEALPYDHYRINISYVGLQPLTLDSIHVRAEREDFNLGDIRLKLKSSEKLEEIIIYLEKPLIESKDGNITFNASESALSNSSSASELLNNVPLVTKDPDGKILVRGKEPRILIDDKPVELNMQQLQDLLESMPGSSVEKIEVMTNPPPQFANEQGGVINIITKKGAVGMGGRVTLFAGTRGDRGGNGSFNYRKKGMSLTVNAGIAGNQLEGWGYSNRQNVYRDSSNFFKTNNNYTNNNWRPNVRMNFDYELNKFNSINAVFQFNQNHFNNSNNTTYRNINRVDELFRLSNRNIRSLGENTNPNLSLNYTLKTKRPGEVFKINSSLNVSDNLNERNFYQHFLDPVTSISWFDSTQLQVTDNNTKGYNLRANYDRPLSNK
ncbi:MAG TPA: TonB-dependent receptor, partial [Flavisolibacter sp.]|nr:TonB-dependent receptor [Flavisolibacter sp.]